jgi:DNA polymerase
MDGPAEASEGRGGAGVIATETRASELYEVIRGCPLCVLAQTRTNAVPGEGPVDAEVMCIGEAPGVNEDKQGRPFVGAAGQFLGQLLAAAGLAREQVYICNVLKCRPPGNRDPLPNEIEACSEYLDLQLDMVDPLVVVTLGRFSMSKWFPQQAISRIHGSVKEVDGRLIVPMYHPAAALHQGNLRQVLVDDFARLPAVLERARAARDGSLPAAAPVTQPTHSMAPVHLTSERPPASNQPRPASEPPWAEPAFVDDTEFEFDPGDAPPKPSALVAAPVPAEAAPAFEPPAPADAPPEAATPTATTLGPTPSPEPTAEQTEPAPAEKTEQIRLFE